jgi:uroporphyrinogen-III decarboxylase
VIDAIEPGTPVINFATGNPMLLPLLAEAGGDVIGLDWRVRLDAAWQTIGYNYGVQGNLDPVLLLADRPRRTCYVAHRLYRIGTPDLTSGCPRDMQDGETEKPGTNQHTVRYIGQPAI